MQRALQFVDHAALDDVHADAAPGDVGDDRAGAQSGQQDQLGEMRFVLHGEKVRSVDGRGAATWFQRAPQGISGTVEMLLAGAPSTSLRLIAR